MNDGLDSLSDDELNTLFGVEVLRYACPLSEHQSKYIQWEQPVVIRHLMQHTWERHRDGHVCVEHAGGAVWACHKTNFIRAAVMALIRRSRITNAK